SPLWTSWPTCLRQLLIAPSSMVSDRRGMKTSGMTASLPVGEAGGVEGFADHADQRGRVRQRGRLKGFGVRQRHLGGGHAPHRGVEAVERALLDAGDDLRA